MEKGESERKVGLITSVVGRQREEKQNLFWCLFVSSLYSTQLQRLTEWESIDWSPTHDDAREEVSGALSFLQWHEHSISYSGSTKEAGETLPNLDSLCTDKHTPRRMDKDHANARRQTSRRAKRKSYCRQKTRVWPGIEPGTSRKLCFGCCPKRESYH